MAAKRKCAAKLLVRGYYARDGQFRKVHRKCGKAAAVGPDLYGVCYCEEHAEQAEYGDQ